MNYMTLIKLRHPNREGVLNLKNHKKVSRSFGKWILSGEHTVLRGGEAVLFPLKQFYFEVSYKETNNFCLHFSSSFQKEYYPQYIHVIKTALKLIEKNPIEGEFGLDCTIPFSAGLGSSAAFCLSLTKMFFQLGWIQKEDILKLSLELEHEFHGKSSGADIQVVYHEKPIIFKNVDSVEILKPKWEPVFYLYDTGVRAKTQQCIQKVNEFIKHNPEQAKELDQQMKQAVVLCTQALKQDQKQGIKLLKTAMNQALECFTGWGLCEGRVLEWVRKLKKQGALAVKPTGSGGGGFVVSVWETSPKFIEKFHL